MKIIWKANLACNVQEEGEFYNVPVNADGEDISANLKKLRVRTDQSEGRGTQPTNQRLGQNRPIRDWDRTDQ